MYYRSNNLLAGTTVKPLEWAAAHSVVAYPIGGVVESSNRAGGQTTAVLLGNFDIQIGDKLLLWRAGQTVYIPELVISSDFTTGTIIIDGDYQIFQNDRLIALGPDSGGLQPLFDASRQTIYQDPDGTLPFVNARVNTDQYGNYFYYIDNQAAWELIIDSKNEPVALLEGNTLISSGASFDVQNTSNQLISAADETIVFDVMDPTPVFRYALASSRIEFWIPGKYHVEAHLATDRIDLTEGISPRWYNVTLAQYIGTPGDHFASAMLDLPARGVAIELRAQGITGTPTLIGGQCSAHVEFVG